MLLNTNFMWVKIKMKWVDYPHSLLRWECWQMLDN